jgi:hypothetical protein
MNAKKYYEFRVQCQLTDYCLTDHKLTDYYLTDVLRNV